MSLRLRGAAVLAVSTLLVAGCGGGDSGSSVSGEPISFEELARSASTSAGATSGRFSFEMAMKLPGASEPFDFSGEGAFDAAAKRASLSFDMSSFAKLLGGFVSGLAGPNSSDLPDFDDPEGWKIQTVQDGNVDYVRFPAIDDQLPDGKTWIQDADGVSGGGFDFDDLERFTSNDPRDLLESLRGITSDIETVGSEQLRGVETTHYHAVVDSAQLAKAKDRDGRSAPQSVVDRLTTQSGLGDIPLDVWIDANGLVRKVSMAFSAKDPARAKSGDASMSFELWDYGEPVEIAVPPASEVAPASALRG
jgi:hypothetical protein